MHSKVVLKLLLEKSIEYANDCIGGKEITTLEVIIQCKWFLRDLERQKNQEYPYYLDVDKLGIIENLLKLMNFATGFITGESVYDGLAPFQCFILCNVFGWRFKDNTDKFRYRYFDLFIARKNAKTFITAIIIVILMLTEDDYSEFYSICKNRDLAGEVKKAINQIITNSPALSDYFKIPKTLSGKCECLLTHSIYQPRTADANSNNAIRPCCVIADEVGAFTKNDNIEAMKSGQRSVRNPLLFKLTTAYAEDKSIFLDELDYLKRIYSEQETDDRIFALLYYSPKEHLWDDTGLYMANPLRIEENYEEIRACRKRAISIPSERDEYLTKSMNYFMPTNKGLNFIELESLRKCSTEKPYDWRGKRVYLGIDLALTTDNCAISMVTIDDNVIHSKSWCFIPSARVEQKSKTERVDYKRYIDMEICFACGDEVVSYGYIEQFIIDIPKKYGVEVVSIGYDRANCISTVDKLNEANFECIEVKQHASIEHAPIKWLQESIYEKKFSYEKGNKLYEENIVNAKVKTDAGGRMYLNKNVANRKIDMIASTINAVYLLQQSVLNGDNDDVCFLI